MEEDDIGFHLWRRCRNMWDNSSYGRKPDISQVCTMVDWQITDLCESYESERNPLLRLARTGFVMKRMTDLHLMIDEATATYNIPESPFLKDWRLHFKEERDGRMDAFASYLEEPSTSMELLKRYRCSPLELLTLLAYDSGKHSENIYTPDERDVIAGVYEEICSHTGICVVSVPQWFIPRHEITERNGDYLWQNVNVEVSQARGGNEELCVYQTAIWSELNHPHVARLLGACHVGSSKLFVFEEADEITRNILRRLPDPGMSENLRPTNTAHRSIWELLLGFAMGLQYLHERGVVCGSLTPEKLLVNTATNSANLLGGDLVLLARVYPIAKRSCSWQQETKSVPSTASDVRDFGFCILSLLRDIATTDYSTWSWRQRIDTPKMTKTLPERPCYVCDDIVWRLLTKMCAKNTPERVEMKYVVEQLQNVVNGEDTLSDDHVDPPTGADIDGRDVLEHKTSAVCGDDTDHDEVGKMNFNGHYLGYESETGCRNSTCQPGVVINFGANGGEMNFDDYFAGDESDSFSDDSACKPEDVAERLAELVELGVFGESSAVSSSELTYVNMADEYEHPDFQTSIRVAMEDIEDQLDDIESPASPMDRHVYERLMSIYGYLQSLSQCRQDLLGAVIDLASSFKWSLADRVNSNSCASRTIASRGIGHRSLAFHHSIDHLLVRFDLPDAASGVHSWKHRWDWDHQVDVSNFDTVLKNPEYFSGLHDEDEQAEVATLLAFELNRRSAKYNTSTRDAMTRALGVLSGEVVGFPNIPRWFVPWHEIEVQGYISSGSFGSVHRGKWFEADVAVKQLFQADKGGFVREVEVWFSLNHPNVIKLFGACHVGTPFFLCEYAENGTLPEFARKEKWQDWVPGFTMFGRPRNPVWAALYNAAKGLHHLHQRGIIHGDLKGNNILVGADQKAKLTDFGLSAFAETRDFQTDEPVGAVRWKAPERLGDVDNGPSFESDIFSFGMCIIELVSGELPWTNNSSDVGVRQAILQGKLPQRPHQFVDDEWSLVVRMCCFEPSRRIDSFSVVMTLRSYVGRLA